MIQPLKPLLNFKYQNFILFRLLDVNVYSSSDVLGNGLSTHTPPTKFLNMPLGEQMLQMFDTMCKSKCSSHISKGFPKVSSSSTIAINLIPIIDLT